MRKNKIVSFIIILLLITTLLLPVYAAETEAKVDINFSSDVTTLKKEDKTIKLKLNIGEFSGINESEPFGGTAILKYDKDVFESVEITANSAWSVTYNKETNKLVFDIGTVTKNTTIAELVFKIKSIDNIKNTKISLDDIVLSNGDIEIKGSCFFDINIKEEENNTSNNNVLDENITDDNVQQVNNVESVIKDNITVDKKNNLSDSTVSNGKLPQTGIGEIALYIIITMIIIAIISAILYKRIPLK